MQSNTFQSRPWGKVVLALILSILVPTSARALPGGFDTTFGGTGKVAFEPWSNLALGPVQWGLQPYKMLEQPGDKVVILGNGQTDNPRNSQVVMTRILSTGAIDTSFGTNGYAFVTADSVNPATFHIPAGIAQMPGGKLLIVTQTSTGAGTVGIYLRRFTANGLLDTSFGVNGLADITRRFPDQMHQCEGDIRKVEATGNGKYLLLCVGGGTFTYAPAVTSRLLRVDGEGVVDLTFGDSGSVDFPMTAKHLELYDFVELADGSFVGTGQRVFSPGGLMATKISANGVPDAGFGTNGVVELPFDPANGSDLGLRILLIADKFVILGTTRIYSAGYPENPKVAAPLLLIGLNQNGTVNTDFGIAGRVTYAEPAAADVDFTSVVYSYTRYAALHRQDGKLIVGTVAYRPYKATALTDPGYNVLLLRTSENGLLDTTFAQGGMWYQRLNLNAKPGNNAKALEVGYTSMVLSTGKLLVAGQAQYASTRDGATTEAPFTLFRLLTAETPVTVVKAGAGSGTVTSSPPGILCGAVCTSTFGATIPTLTATAAPGSVFTGWQGACSGQADCIVNEGGARNASATFAPDSVLPLRVDVDGNGAYEARTDGLLALRYMAGLTGTSLTADALAANATLIDPSLILSKLNNVRPIFDVDGNGQVDALTDGLMIIRYLSGLRGAALIGGALGPGAARRTSNEIELYIQSRMP